MTKPTSIRCPTDLVQVFVAGEYEDVDRGNSTWSEGDWNCDEEFNSADIVVAFQAAGFVAESTQKANGLAAAVAAVDNLFRLDSAENKKASFKARDESKDSVESQLPYGWWFI